MRRDPATGALEFRAIVWDEAGERVVRFAVDAAREGERVVAQRREIGASEAVRAVVAIGPGGEPVCDAAAVSDDVASDGVWSVRVARRAGCSTVVATEAGRADVVVWDAWGTAAAPTVAACEDGAWVAFHHNVREELDDSGEPDLAKWIALRFVSNDGHVFEPEALMKDRDRDREGEEQSFEFPSLVVGDDGAVALFGRGSHSFWRQDANAWGFDARVPLGDGTWGCRGRRVAVARAGDGTLVTARREKGEVIVDTMAEPMGGRPALVPVEVRVEPRYPRIESPDESALRCTTDGRRVLFGDIHQHSAHSDGLGTADEPYLRARHIYGDDFCALTDHESFLGKRVGPGEWAYLCAVADRHDAPGEFATLLGYEWTGKSHPGPGHKVVYLPARGGPIWSRDDFATGKQLLARVREHGAFAVPHHIGWTGADEGAHDPATQPVWEICSCHGCYEHWAHELGQRGDLRDQMVDAVLRRGRRFGFIASSDGHGLLYHHGVARKRDPFRTGLTAVLATACTREAILDAIRARRCYATSGAKIVLEMSVGGQPMGSEFGSGAGELDADVRVLGETEVARIELVGPGGVLAQVPSRSRDSRLHARVRGPYVYARVVQVDGEMAWSSPVFWG